MKSYSVEDMLQSTVGGGGEGVWMKHDWPHVGHSGKGVISI